MADPTQSRGLRSVRRKDTHLELTENDHAFLADLLQKAEEAGEDVIHPHCGPT
jgi:hypothetical protein